MSGTVFRFPCLTWYIMTASLSRGMMDRVSEQEDYMLYALLNGGAPYLRRDAGLPEY